jgi:hypothetical protein
MDSGAAARHYRRMRMVLTLLLLALAACSGNPSAYGITGPARPSGPQPTDDAVISAPGIPDGSTVVGPSMTPSTGSGRFWGYN